MSVQGDIVIFFILLSDSRPQLGLPEAVLPMKSLPRSCISCKKSRISMGKAIDGLGTIYKGKLFNIC